jgi:hypothetical protein
MNWYKRAKVIDNSDDPQIAYPLLCSTCKRWGTTDVENKLVWKYYIDMTLQERLEVDRIKKLSDQGSSKFELCLCEDCAR